MLKHCSLGSTNERAIHLASTWEVKETSEWKTCFQGCSDSNKAEWENREEMNSALFWTLKSGIACNYSSTEKERVFFCEWGQKARERSKNVLWSWRGVFYVWVWVKHDNQENWGWRERAREQIASAHGWGRAADKIECASQLFKSQTLCKLVLRSWWEADTICC